MGRKKIQITRIMDERNRQVRNNTSSEIYLACIHFCKCLRGTTFPSYVSPLQLHPDSHHGQKLQKKVWWKYLYLVIYLFLIILNYTNVIIRRIHKLIIFLGSKYCKSLRTCVNISIMCSDLLLHFFPCIMQNTQWIHNVISNALERNLLRRTTYYLCDRILLNNKDLYIKVCQLLKASNQS